MSTNVTGYTGLDIDGKASLRTGAAGAFILTAGDRILTRAEATAGFIYVSNGHATNAVVIPTAVATEFAEGQAGAKLIVFANLDAANPALIKVAGGTAITVAANNRAIVTITPLGTLARVTADSLAT